MNAQKVLSDTNIFYLGATRSSQKTWCFLV